MTAEGREGLGGGEDVLKRAVSFEIRLTPKFVLRVITSVLFIPLTLVRTPCNRLE